MDKYIAIKVKGINHWFWFEINKVSRKDFAFEGKNGWGLNGALTEIKIKDSEIEGEITSDELQY